MKLSTLTKKRQMLWIKEIQKRVGKCIKFGKSSRLPYKYSVLLPCVCYILGILPNHSSGITSAMLGSMKGIKMSGLTQKMTELIGNLRIKEVQVAKKFRLLNVYGATLGIFPIRILYSTSFGLLLMLKRICTCNNFASRHICNLHDCRFQG